MPDDSAVRFSSGCVAKTYPAFFEDLQKMRDHQAKGQAHNSCVLAVSVDPSPSRALAFLLSWSLLGAGGRGDVRGARGAAIPPIEPAMFSPQFSRTKLTCRLALSTRPPRDGLRTRDGNGRPGQGVACHYVGPGCGL